MASGRMNSSTGSGGAVRQKMGGGTGPRKRRGGMGQPIPVRNPYRPVRIVARVGEQLGLAQAFRNRTPCRASSIKCGVGGAGGSVSRRDAAGYRVAASIQIGRAHV